VAAESVARAALSLETAVVVNESTTTTLEDDSFTTSTENSQTSFGLLNAGLGVGAAYGVSDNVVLGAQVLLSSTSYDRDTKTTDGTSSMTNSSSGKSSRISIYPRVEYVFGDNSTSFRPFLAGMLGLSSETSGPDETEITVSRHSFGAGLGAHGFVTPHFSIDPLLSIHRFGGSVDIEGNTGSSPDITGTVVALTVSLTGWFGGSSTSLASTDDAPPAPVVRPAPAVSAPPADDSEAEEFPAMKTTQITPGDHAVMLKGRPEALPKSVMIRLAERVDSDKLQGCSEVRLVVGERSYRAEHLSFRGRKTIGRQSRFVSDGLLSAQAIYSALDVDGAYLDVCGTAWQLTPAVRDGFRTFLIEFARRRGTPFEEPNAQPQEAPAPADGAVPIAPTPPAPTEAPASKPVTPAGTAPAAPGAAPPTAPPAQPKASAAPKAVAPPKPATAPRSP
jgi:hypothetical protein